MAPQQQKQKQNQRQQQPPLLLLKRTHARTDRSSDAQVYRLWMDIETCGREPCDNPTRVQAVLLIQA